MRSNATMPQRTPRRNGSFHERFLSQRLETPASKSCKYQDEIGIMKSRKSYFSERVGHAERIGSSQYEYTASENGSGVLCKLASTIYGSSSSREPRELRNQQLKTHNTKLWNECCRNRELLYEHGWSQTDQNGWGLASFSGENRILVI